MYTGSLFIVITVSDLYIAIICSPPWPRERQRKGAGPRTGKRARWTETIVPNCELSVYRKTICATITLRYSYLNIMSVMGPLPLFSCPFLICIVCL